MAKDTVKKDETLEKRVTRLEAYLRKIVKYVEVHWGIDIDKDGEVGRTRIWVMPLMATLVFVGTLFAADTTIWSLRPSVDETAPDCYVTSDGTDATLVVNKWTGNWTGTVTNFAVTGTLTVTGAQTNTSTLAVGGAVSLGAGLTTVTTGTLTLASTNNLTGVNTLSGATTISGTGSLFSNSTAKVYAKTYEVVAGGTVTAPATATLTLASTNILSGVTTLSNATAKVYALTFEQVAGGTFAQPATGTFTLAGTNNFTGVVKVDSTQTGFTGVQTNLGYGVTTLVWMAKGLVTNVTYVGTP